MRRLAPSARCFRAKVSQLDQREPFVVKTVSIGYALCTATEKVSILLFPGTALQIALLIAFATVGFLMARRHGDQPAQGPTVLGFYRPRLHLRHEQWRQ